MDELLSNDDRFLPVCFRLQVNVEVDDFEEK